MVIVEGAGATRFVIKSNVRRAPKRGGDFLTPTNYSSSSSGVAEGDSPGGCCFPCLSPPDCSGADGVSRGLLRGPLRGPNFAEGDGPVLDEGDSSGATLCRGEMRDRGGEVDFGEAEADGLGDGEGVDAGATVALGETAGTAVGVGLVPPGDDVFDVFEDHENAPVAMSFSRAAAVKTSAALKLPSVFFA